MDVGEVRYRAGVRVAAKQRAASNSADGPRKNFSPTVGEAKLASALRSMPTTSIQVPHRKMALGSRETQYPARLGPFTAIIERYEHGRPHASLATRPRVVG